MARRAHAYPQVDCRAASLVDSRVVRASGDVSAAAALDLLRRRGGQALLLAGRSRIVLLEDLARAVALGLPALAAADLERTVPVVRGGDSEILVRRRWLEGALAVLVVDAGPIGIIRRPSEPRADVPLAARLRARVDPQAFALLADVGRLARAAGARAFAVGGVVRDTLVEPGPGGAGRRDLDVVVEGDGRAVARRLAQALGGRLTVHEAFGTASIEGLAGGRLDVATARAERYSAPGALPAVRPGTIAEDLARRDFGINAMAIELTSGECGLVDPLGGRADVAGRRIRVLHPLSFVEDPTRILRAARYATRLGMRLDRATVRARALALRLAPYPALSGARIAGELSRLLEEAAPAEGLRRLGAWGAFRLLDRRWVFSRVTAERTAALEAALGWTRRHALAATPLEVAALIVAGDQRADVRAAALRRLGFSGEPLARIEAALDGVPRLIEQVRAGSSGPPSRLAALLRERSVLALAWAWMLGEGRVRARLDWYLARAASVRPELRGEDLLALGVPRGPLVGSTLRQLRDARIDGRVQSREDEVATVRRWRGEQLTRSTIPEGGMS
jgi:tRNA nucleotidyltransferase (CCA-adding enzyme)